MHIEIFEGAKKMWYWHFRSKGRVTADSEAFTTKAHAVRAAKAVVAGVINCVPIDALQLHFDAPEWDAKRTCWVIRWG